VELGGLWGLALAGSLSSWPARVLPRSLGGALDPERCLTAWFGLVQVSEGDVIYGGNPEITGPPRDVCESCQERPIAELIISLKTTKDEKNSLTTAHLTLASTPPLPPSWPGRPPSTGRR
jgi:hypothetical protein